MSDTGDGNVRTALALMRMALALLDRTGVTLTAARLQHAIDTTAAEDLTTPAPHDPDIGCGSGLLRIDDGNDGGA
jgi:hypothetical protein